MRVLIIKKNHFSLCHKWIEFISRSFRKFKNYNKVQKLEQIFNYFPIDRVRSRGLLCWFSALFRWSTIFQLHLLLSSVVEQTQSVFSQNSSMKISWGDLISSNVPIILAHQQRSQAAAVDLPKFIFHRRNTKKPQTTPMTFDVRGKNSRGNCCWQVILSWFVDRLEKMLLSAWVEKFVWKCGAF